MRLKLTTSSFVVAIMKISSTNMLTLHEHFVFTFRRYGVPCAKTTTRIDIQAMVKSTCFIITIIFHTIINYRYFYVQLMDILLSKTYEAILSDSELFY